MLDPTQGSDIDRVKEGLGGLNLTLHTAEGSDIDRVKEGFDRLNLVSMRPRVVVFTALSRLNTSSMLAIFSPLRARWGKLHVSQTIPTRTLITGDRPAAI